MCSRRWFVPLLLVFSLFFNISLSSVHCSTSSSYLCIYPLAYACTCSGARRMLWKMRDGAWNNLTQHAAATPKCKTLKSLNRWTQIFTQTGVSPSPTDCARKYLHTCRSNECAPMRQYLSLSAFIPAFLQYCPGIHTCVYTSMCYAEHTYLHTYLPTHLPTYVHTYVTTYIHPCAHTIIQLDSYIHAFILSFIFAFLHSYIRTFAHTYIHTYMHWLRACTQSFCLFVYLSICVNLRTLSVYLSFFLSSFFSSFFLPYCTSTQMYHVINVICDARVLGNKLTDEVVVWPCQVAQPQSLPHLKAAT